MKTKEYKNFIGGSFRESSTGNRFRSCNPADISQLVGVYQSSGSVDVQDAIDAALFASEEWRKTPAPKRGEILFRAARIVEERAEELAVLLTREVGKTLPESRGELHRTVRIFEYFGGEGARLLGQVIPSERESVFAMTKRRQLGIVTLITPWNFPAAIPAWKLTPALVCGNCVVLKPSSLAPALSMELCEIVREAGIPDGVFTIITGSGSEVGSALVENPSVSAVSFTGSAETGAFIRALSRERNIRLQLEMGGSNPTIVLADADLEHAASATVNAAFMSAGQKCTATSRAIVEKSVLGKFTEILVRKAEALRVGDPLEPDITMGPVISEEQLSSNLRYIEIAKADGARLLTGGERLAGGTYDKGYYLSPTIFGDVSPDMRIAKEEVFGPVMCIISAEGFEDAIRIANGVRYGLSATLCSKDMAKIMRYLDRIEAGVIMVNLPSAGVEYQVPFGGVKESSSGLREQGPVAIDFYSELQSVYIGY
jgi:acyl-CoA reductase-like NAD-dependent aldehyde dehydrogenase